MPRQKAPQQQPNSNPKQPEVIPPQVPTASPKKPIVKVLPSGMKIETY